MQTTLLGLAITVIAALLAALIGPYFVDWSQFRPQFEREAARVIGVPVQVDGEIDARLLPTPSLRTADEVWGCLYVVEGAALGGGLIAAEARRGDLPCRFFTGTGEERGRRWREFRSALGSWLAGAGDVPAVTASAARTFGIFERVCVPAS